MFTLTFTMNIFYISGVFCAVYVKAICPHIKGVPNFNMSAVSIIPVFLLPVVYDSDYFENGYYVISDVLVFFN